MPQLGGNILEYLVLNTSIFLLMKPYLFYVFSRTEFYGVPNWSWYCFRIISFKAWMNFLKYFGPSTSTTEVAAAMLSGVKVDGSFSNDSKSYVIWAKSSSTIAFLSL